MNPVLQLHVMFIVSILFYRSQKPITQNPVLAYNARHTEPEQEGKPSQTHRDQSVVDHVAHAPLP